MSEPFFQIGDHVEYELDPSGYYPRWDGKVDRGYSGNFERAVVVLINNVSIRTIPLGNIRAWHWPISGDNYEASQWARPGYLRKVPVVGAKKPCTCGAEKVKTTHSHWCDSCR